MDTAQPENLLSTCQNCYNSAAIDTLENSSGKFQVCNKCRDSILEARKKKVIMCLVCNSDTGKPRFDTKHFSSEPWENPCLCDSCFDDKKCIQCKSKADAKFVGGIMNKSILCDSCNEKRNYANNLCFFGQMIPHCY